MHRNVYAEILWLILLDKYLVNECNLKMSRTYSSIFFKKDYKGRLELVMLVDLDYVFIAGKLETWKKAKEKIKENFNISEFGKVKKFLGVYYEWGRDAKGMHEKMTMDKDVKKLLEGCDKYTGGDVKVQKTPGSPGTNLIISDLEEPYNIDNHR